MLRHAYIGKPNKSDEANPQNAARDRGERAASRVVAVQKVRDHAHAKTGRYVKMLMLIVYPDPGAQSL
jgi:hypothetical protein